MEAVGYDLYVKMLNEAVLEESGKKKPEESFDTSVDLPFDAFIPDQYVTSEDVRMELYQRIAQIGTEEEASDMMDELIDRFGDEKVIDMDWVMNSVNKAGE